MSAVVDSSVTFSGFEKSKRPTFTDHHHSSIYAFHRFSLLREKNIMTDAVISSIDKKRWLKYILIPSFQNISKDNTAYSSPFTFFFNF